MSSEIKGRIIVYSIVGCPHCKKAKSTLEELKLPYHEISLDSYADTVREEVREKTGSRTVPQIFFNATLIGGNDEFQKLITEDKSKFEQLLEEVRNNEPTSDAPQIPDESLLLKDQDGEIDFSCEKDEDALLIDDLKASGIIKDHSYLLVFSNKNTFAGTDLCGLDNETQSVADRDKALEIGKHLFDKGFFHIVKGKPVGEFTDSSNLCRLYEHEETSALNSGLVSDCESRPASELSESLRKLILSIYNDFLSKDGKGVDYKGIASSPKFEKYVKATAELTRVAVEDSSEEEKLAFFINIYNALVIHGNVRVGAPRTLWQRYKFFNYTSYIIGGHRYSLQDIENGILRSNRKAVGALSLPFKKNDPRLKVALAKNEPLIHFALVCGAKSCPPIKTYSAEGVHDQLKVAAEAFLESEDGCHVEAEKSEVHLSRIFKWYQEDFGGNDQETAKWVHEYMGEGTKKDDLQKVIESNQFKVIYMHYDWSVNSQH
ncbi:hypothetical protein BSL78_10465 [Apostichopus japonicus]|uniref:Uncharacterized protein n=1 Tax=Stichopus japonicus TaxID=307972 RepID=A0A2G8KXC7_STIJA|nr:hypothetical protein BSL78_10465 [Apostichopus japonicus]